MKSINIYKITNQINDKVYIGQTIRPIEKRFSEHCRISSGCKYLKNAIQKYGKENFSIELLTICQGQECANCIETFYIAANNSIKNGYNIAEIIDGGSGLSGKKLSEEHKRKLSENNCTKRPEIRQKMSDAKKGKPSPNKGKIASEQTRQKSSLSHKGFVMPEATKLKISLASKGKKKVRKMKDVQNG